MLSICVWVVLLCVNILANLYVEAREEQRVWTHVSLDHQRVPDACVRLVCNTVSLGVGWPGHLRWLGGPVGGALGGGRGEGTLRVGISPPGGTNTRH